MSAPDPSEPYAIELHRVRLNEHATLCATLDSTGVLVWLFADRTFWCSNPRHKVPDTETAFLPRWVAEQYPTLRREVEKQDAQFESEWGIGINRRGEIV